MRSNNFKTVMCPKDLKAMNHGEGKTRGCTSFRLRNYCVMGTLLAMILGFLSTPYVETSLRQFMEDNLALQEPLRLENFSLREPLRVKEIEGFVDGTDSDGPLRKSEEDLIEGQASPRKVPEDSEMSYQQNVRSCVGVVAVENEGKVRPSEGSEHSKIVQSDERSSRNWEDGIAYEESPIVHLLEENKSADSATEKDNPATGHVSDVEKERREKMTFAQSGGREQEGIEGSSNSNDVFADKLPVLKDAANTNEHETSHKKPVQGLQRSNATATKSANSTTTKGRCNISAGEWIPDPIGPLYRFNQCKLLSAAQNCQLNGRPDHQYEFYRWQPEQCTIPRFDPHAFLEMMRGKTLAFVGDSLARNQMESLMCMLLQAADARPKGNKNMHRWYFGAYQFTVVRMWSSWLVRTKVDFPSLAPKDVTNLNLTELDEYAYHLPKFDVTILSCGHWWLRKTAFFWDGKMLGGAGWPWLPKLHGEKKMDPAKAFGIAVNTALNKTGTYPGYKGLTILRTYTPDHYSGGSWDTGGSCTGETKPYATAPANSYNEMMYNKQLAAFKRNTKRGEIMPNGSKLKLLDVYPVLNYRGDGHPGPYRNLDPNKRTTRDAKGNPPPQDCLHWCMPGPVDTTNELLAELLREEFQRQ